MQSLQEEIFYSGTIMVQKLSLSRLYLYNYHNTLKKSKYRSVLGLFLLNFNPVKLNILTKGYCLLDYADLSA